jgi:hypothetical protein
MLHLIVLPYVFHRAIFAYSSGAPDQASGSPDKKREMNKEER